MFKSAGLTALRIALSPLILVALSAFATILVLYVWACIVIGMLDDPYTEKGN